MCYPHITAAATLVKTLGVTQELFLRIIWKRRSESDTLTLTSKAPHQEARRSELGGMSGRSAVSILGQVIQVKGV